MLYPGDSQAYRKLGNDVCKESIPKFFKIFLRIPRPQYIITKAAIIWKSYYDTGKIEVLENENNVITIKLTEFPNFPGFLRDFLCGYIAELYEKYNLTSTLFPVTNSCVAPVNGKHCSNCWFCNERKWAFGRI